MPRAVEEGLRWEAPLINNARVALCDTEIEGTSIPAGAPIISSLGSANRDPSRWSDPDRFDVFREPPGHLAFGFGSHICLGIHLARMEMRIALNAVLDRLANVRFDPDTGSPFIRGLSFRAPNELSVLFGPRPEQGFGRQTSTAPADVNTVGSGKPAQTVSVMLRNHL